MRITHERVPAHGLTLELESYGDALSRPPSDPTLLFLHGFGHGAWIWRSFATPLAERYRVFALNARGHAGSDPDPQYRYHNAAQARDVGAVVDHLGLGRLAIVGHSMGGHVAIRFGSFHQGRLSRLLLVEASCEVPPGNRRDSGQASLERERSFDSVAAFAQRLAVSYPKLAPEVVGQLAKDWLRERGDGRYELDIDPVFLRPKRASDVPMRRDFDGGEWSRLESEKLRRYAADLTCPTLVLRGGESKMVSSESVERMVDEVLADGRALTIPGAGHSLMLDAPEAFRKALLEFFG